MRSRLLRDSARRPELFDWQGPLDRERLHHWVKERGFQLPSDLLLVWRETGGGEMFESESLLAPFGSVTLGDDVDGVNAAYRSKGMPSEYLLFHVGLCLSAVCLRDGAYVTFKPGSFHEGTKCNSFDEWYDDVIRDEYAKRYRLID